MSERRRQPTLHGLVTCLSGSCAAISSEGGDIVPGGAQGVFLDDVRQLSALTLGIDGAAVEPAGHRVIGADRAVFQAVVRGIGDDRPEPSVWIVSDRVVSRSGMRQELTIRNGSEAAVDLRVRLRASADRSPVAVVRDGRGSAPLDPVRLADGSGLSWTGGDGATSRLASHPAPTAIEGGELMWVLHLAPGADAVILIALGTEAARSDRQESGPSRIEVRSADPRFGAFVSQSVADLRALTRPAPDHPADSYLAAGSPWYLTLFGRDSLWAARMSLPLGTATAMGTLRTLARHQGTTDRPDTAEQPGKILHELRRSDLPHALPAVFFGSADATCLWIILLRDAWLWGAPEIEVRALLPALDAALDWLLFRSDGDGDGFIDYDDIEGIGAINQGWKDSPDSIHHADGAVATGPIALCELQGYGYQAARAGAELLQAFGLPGSRELLEFAEALRSAFRERFWADGGGRERFPALAIDGEGRRAEVLTSNIGHLLGTAFLSAEEEDVVARHLTGPDLLTPFGIRTLAPDSPRYSPLSYHNGSVWPHDSAIAMQGLRQHGDLPGAATIARRLVAAADLFDGRLPELWGGESLAGAASPLIYPTACRPQAWSAATALVVLRTILGLEVDAPRRRISLSPMNPMPFGALRLRGFRVAGEPFELDVDADGVASIVNAPLGFDVRMLRQRRATMNG